MASPPTSKVDNDAMETQEAVCELAAVFEQDATDVDLGPHGPRFRGSLHEFLLSEKEINHLSVVPDQKKGARKESKYAQTVLSFL